MRAVMTSWKAEGVAKMGGGEGKRRNLARGTSYIAVGDYPSTVSRVAMTSTLSERTKLKYYPFYGPRTTDHGRDFTPNGKVLYKRRPVPSHFSCKKNL